MSDAVAPERTGPARWSADEIDRIERRMGEIEARRERGEELTPDEAAAAQTLQTMLDAEAEARDAFSAFYASVALADGQDGGAAGSLQLPAGVTAKVNRWIESTKRWEALAAALLETAPPETAPPAARSPARVRTGPRLRATLPAFFRMPTAEPAKDALSALFAPHLWKANAAGTAISAQRNDTHVLIECDDALGFGPERAIQQIAKHGASAAQTFLTMAGLWLQQNRDNPSHETYLTAHASDLLRFQRRKETPRGGYHREDLLAKGRDVYILSRISVPRSEVVAYDNGRRVVKTLSIGRLLSLESLDTEETVDAAAPDEVRSVVRFRYHLGKEIYDWVCGDHPQYAAISGKLLTYHPIRQKYQILLGFCLAYYDRVNRKNRAPERSIRLPALLGLAAIAIPDKRIAEFLTTIEDALRELARDGVIPGVRLRKPDNWTELLAHRKTRDIIAGSVVEFPRLIPARDEPAAPSARQLPPAE